MWRTRVRPPVAAHELLHAFLQLLLASPLHHHLRVGYRACETGLRHIFVNLCCQATVFSKPIYKKKLSEQQRAGIKNRKSLGRSAQSFGVLFSLVCPGGEDKVIRKDSQRRYVGLPVLSAESLLVSIRNAGKLLLSLLFLLLLFLGQSPLKVLDHSVLLFFWPVTLTLLVTAEEGRADEEEARDTLWDFFLFLYIIGCSKTITSSLL